MTKFKLVALGGTFDIIHRGHLELLRNGFSISSRVIIGLTSDELARKKEKNQIMIILKDTKHWMIPLRKIFQIPSMK